MHLFKNFIVNKSVLLSMILIVSGVFIDPVKTTGDSTTVKTVNKTKFNTIQLERWQIISELNESVSTYIHEKAPKSKVSGSKIVEVCIKYNMDITFVMAQAMLESHFGTRGTAKKTNSVFNVGTYDNGKILCVYKNPDASIEPYVKLIKTSYLKDKTIKQLLKNHNFKNLEGKRFASRVTYEWRMRHVMKRIRKITDIYTLQKKLNEKNKELSDLNNIHYGNSNTIKREI